MRAFLNQKSSQPVDALLWVTVKVVELVGGLWLGSRHLSQTLFWGGRSKPG